MAIKFRAEKKILTEILIPAAAATSNKHTLAQLEGILLVLQGNTLAACGYDLEKGIRTEGEVIGVTDGSVIISASTFLAVIRSMPDGDITVTADDSNTVKIESGMSKFTLHGLSGDTYPNLPELAGDKGFTVKSSVLKKIINATYFAVAKTEARPILMGEYFRIKNGELTVVALDNFRLALRREKDAVVGETNLSFVVPGKSLYDFSRFLTDGDETVKVEITAKHIIMSIGNITFFSRLLEGEYADYDRAIPKSNKTFVRVMTAELVSAVERATLIIDPKIKTPLKCLFTDGTLNITCTTQAGTINENINIDKEGADIEIGFNNQYLLDALRACGEESIKASLSTPLMSMILTDGSENFDDSSFLYLVLPYRLNK